MEKKKTQVCKNRQDTLNAPTLKTRAHHNYDYWKFKITVLCSAERLRAASIFDPTPPAPYDFDPPHGRKLIIKKGNQICKWFRGGRGGQFFPNNKNP